MRKKWLSVLSSTILSVTLIAPAAGAVSPNKVSPTLSAEAITQMQAILDQQSFSGKPYLYEGLNQIGNAESIKIIVQLTSNPLAVVKAKKEISGRSFTASAESSALRQIQSQQKQFQDELRKQGISSKVEHSYSKVVNAVSLEVTGSDLNKLIKMDGVKAIYPDLEVKLDPEQVKDTESEAQQIMNAASYLGSDQLPYKGEGVDIGVIDTGIDYEHPVLKDAYVGGWDFVNGDDDPYETTYQEWVKANAADPIKFPEFNRDNSSYYTEHGSHVSGIIAARDESEFNVVGIAPKAKIHAYKVLGPYGSGQSSWVIGGIEKAVEDGVDIINLSLGNTSNDSNYITSIAINNAMLDGVVAVIASGNSGPQRYTVGSPGTSTFGITVGNSTLPSPVVNAKAEFTDTVTSVTYATYTKDLMAWNIAEDPSLLEGTSLQVVYAGLGYPEDFNKIKNQINGNIALIARGTLAFVDKIANARAAGAKAAIIYNNVPGDIPYLLGDDINFIPTVSLSQEAGQKLLNKLSAQPGSLKVQWSNFSKSEQPGDDINDSSSRGPVKDTLNIKPDVVAPGTNILSSVPAYGKENPSANYDLAYARLTGTSMAAPQVAGISALILEAAKEHYPDREFSPFDVKALLMNTAKVLDPETYDLFDQGAGRVQPVRAVETAALAEVIDSTSYIDQGNVITRDNVTGSINFGRFLPTDDTTVDKKIVVENLSGQAQNYTVTNIVYQTVTGVDNSNIVIDTTVNTPELTDSFILNDKQEIKVSFKVPSGVTASGELQGYLVITSEDGNTRLSVPYVAFFNKRVGLKGFKYIQFDAPAKSGLPYYPLDNEGELALTSGKFESYNDNAFVDIELFDGLNMDGGYDGEGHIGFIYNPVLDDIVYMDVPADVPLSYSWDGYYYDPIEEDLLPVKDGLYTLDVYGFVDEDDHNPTFDDTDPFIIKTEAPVVDVNTTATLSSGSSFKGKVKDLNIEIAPALKEGWDQDLLVKDVLDATFTLTTKSGGTAASGSFDIGQDGTFSIPMNGIASGSYNLKLEVTDQVGLTGSKTVDLTITSTSGYPTNPGIPVTTTPGSNSGTGAGNPISLGDGTLTETTADGKITSSVLVSDSVITSQASSSETKEIVVDLTKADFTKYASSKLSLSAAATKTLQDSGKALVLKAAGFTLTIPAGDVNNFITDHVFTIPFAWGKTNPEHKFPTLNGGSYNTASNEFTLLSDKTSFPAPLILNLKLDPSSDVQKTGIYSLSTSGEWVYVSSGKLTVPGEMTAAVQSPGTYSLAGYSKTFADLSAHWAKKQAEVAAAHHLFVGKGSTDTFKPNDRLTQAEFKTLFDRLLGTGSDWAARSKEAGASHVLTREEVAVILSQVLEVNLSSFDGSAVGFKDASSISPASLPAVQFAKEKGYLQGTGSNTFDPKGELTRAQAAVLIYRVLQDLQQGK